MIKKFNIRLILIFFFAGIIIFNIISNQNSKQISESKSNFFLNTLINITLYGEHSDENFEDIFNIIKRYENILSKTIETSDIYKINSSSGISAIKVSDETMNVIDKSIYFSDISFGKFDITIGPIVDSWGIGTENERIPSEDEISEKLKFVNYKKIQINDSENTVFLPEKEMKIDLGGIAKGYIGDRIIEYIKSQNIQGALVNLGGNILVVGDSGKNNGDWNIGVQDPFSDRGSYLGIITLSEGSIVSSGDYERFFVEDGKKYHHIFDTSTGFPVDNEISGVTIFSSYSVDGDALSTSIFALGIEDGIALINSLEGVECIIVTKEKTIICSDGILDKFKLTNNSYKIEYNFSSSL